jgi:hypothetical protein
MSETKTKPLTKAMREVLAELAKPGARAIYMPYMGRFNENPYYFVTTTMKLCTKQIEGLASRGFLDRVDKDNFGGHYCCINAKGLIEMEQGS